MRVHRLLLLLFLIGVLPTSVLATDLALLVGEDSKAIRRAAAGIEAIEGVTVTRFDLFRGAAAVDDALEKMGRFQFDGTVALGNRAYEFSRSHHFEKNFTATMVAGISGADVIPYEALPEDWAAVLTALLPEGGEVAAVACGPDRNPALRRLGTALEAGRRRLLVEHPKRGEEMERTARRGVKRAKVFFLQRDRELLRRRVILSILNTAHENKVAVLGFSRAFVQAGALLALEVTPEGVGGRAAALALGRDPPRMETRLYINEKRAAYLGLEIPDALRHRFR